MADAASALPDSEVFSYVQKWSPENDKDDSDSAGDATTPSTTTSDAGSTDSSSEDDEVGREVSCNSLGSQATTEYVGDVEEDCDQQLGPGLYHNDDTDEEDQCRIGDAEEKDLPEPVLREAASKDAIPSDPVPEVAAETALDGARIEPENTLFVFDWDDTVLPSTWIQSQGLRLDAGSTVSDAQRAELTAVAESVSETLHMARQCGTVVVVTNAERGWIELSCHKFLPTLAPLLEGVRRVSARTTYESPQCPAPLDWKISAFESEAAKFVCHQTAELETPPKNILSLGDGAHEREALMRVTYDMPNCHAKSLKFVERPSLSQILRQHDLVKGWFDRIVHYNGDLDLCIKCD